MNLIDASALESLEAIADRLRAASVGFHLSEVKGPVMDALKRSDFFEHFKGQVFLSQFEAVGVLASGTEAGAPATASLPLSPARHGLTQPARRVS